MIELIEYTNPPWDAMVRSFHCCICDKQHLHKGRIVRVWVGGAGGYAAQAAEDCWLNIQPRATEVGIRRMYFRLWGKKEFAKSPWEISSKYFEDGEILDLTQVKR